ncbi:MAG TPA: baseplate J/gp47 family protein [Oligoflexus sp.]|uniref:baseplate J/gp47 family protein n=1 Tax=Oligoflexus sp. TaxID=1971216 RepID=UPI002D2B4A3F|nr:baseplate J/gp47 family protein [Oligoflexus sp.]HYX33521.1 baseplate J/gp47 family protein [Oligoflexus sp.]
MADFARIRAELMNGILRDGQRVPENLDPEYLIKALAEGVFSQQLRINYLTDQILPSTADEKYLLLHGRNKKIPRGQGSKARGFALTNAPSGFLGVGARLISSSGAEYIVLYGVNDEFSYAIESVEIGEDKNLQFNAVLRVVNPIDLLDSLVVSITGITGGSDIETIESYQERVIDAWANTGTYGSTESYYTWLKEIQELSKSFIFEVTPFPGVTSWAALVRIGDDDWDFPNTLIINKVQEFLNARRPPGARIQWLTEAGIVRLTLIIFQVPEELQEQLTFFIRNQIYERAAIKGASNMGSGEVTEGYIRNIISAFLDGSDFNVVIGPTDKIGRGRLNFGEIILLGNVVYA